MFMKPITPIDNNNGIFHICLLESAELLHEINKKIFSECSVTDHDALEQIRRNCILIQSLLE